MKINKLCILYFFSIFVYFSNNLYATTECAACDRPSVENCQCSSGTSVSIDGYCRAPNELIINKGRNLDYDGDCVYDIDDNCPNDSNPDQADINNDGNGDACYDTDGDGTNDAFDSCINDPDNDIDTDGICGDVDNCPNDSNIDQIDTDNDGIGDICDSDLDGDGVDNINDNCPNIPNADQADLDNDNIGDTCDDDQDGDSFTTANGDCNDRDGNIYPNATEICDNIDNNCDGNIDENIPTNTYYADTDNDSFGDPNTSTDSCSQPSGYVTDNTDCDDGNSAVNPAASEVCGDGIDNNCSGSDEVCAIAATCPCESEINQAIAEFTAANLTPPYYNRTYQAYDRTKPPYNYSYNSASRYLEIYGSSYPYQPYLFFNIYVHQPNTSINDYCAVRYDKIYRDIFINSGYRIFIGTNEERNDQYLACAKLIDDFVVYNAKITSYCSGNDCPSQCTYNSNITETCNNLDDNCDGQIDEGLIVTAYPDNDGDGFGATTSVQVCPNTPGYIYDSNLATDCDDNNNSIYPGAIEICDGVDSNCDGNLLPAGAEDDYDNDGVLACDGDCDDNSSLAYPGHTEVCSDNIDNDCNGQIDDVDCVPLIDLNNNSTGSILCINGDPAQGCFANNSCGVFLVFNNVWGAYYSNFKFPQLPTTLVEGSIYPSLMHDSYNWYWKNDWNCQGFALGRFVPNTSYYPSDVYITILPGNDYCIKMNSYQCFKKISR